MNNLTVLKCPKCGSTCIDQFRMLIGPIWCRNCGFRVEEKEKHNPFIHQGESCEEKPTHARPEVEKFIAIIEDELCKRMDIDDFDRFFTELATELMRNYGPSIPAAKEKPAPTRPEAVHEAMEMAECDISNHRAPYTFYLLQTLAAYVRELEAKVGNMKKGDALLEKVSGIFGELKTTKMTELSKENDRLKAELAEARKGE